MVFRIVAKLAALTANYVIHDQNSRICGTDNLNYDTLSQLFIVRVDLVTCDSENRLYITMYHQTYLRKYEV